MPPKRTRRSKSPLAESSKRARTEPSSSAEGAENNIVASSGATGQDNSPGTTSLPLRGQFGRISSARGLANGAGGQRRPRRALAIIAPAAADLARLQVNRRGGVPPLALVGAPFATTNAQQTLRVDALRNVIGVPVGRSKLVEVLTNNNWNVPVAAQAFYDRYPAGAASVSANAQPASQTVGRRPNVSEARARAIHDFSDEIAGARHGQDQTQLADFAQGVGILTYSDVRQNAFALDAETVARGRVVGDGGDLNTVTDLTPLATMMIQFASERLDEPEIPQDETEQWLTIQSDLRNLIEHRRPREVGDLVGLFYGTNFDTEEATREYNGRNGDLSVFHDAIEEFRSPRPNEIERDRRLAEFINFTDVDNWQAALELLEGHQWDMSRALEGWYAAKGQLAEPEEEVKDDGFRVFREALEQDDDDASDSSWAVTRRLSPQPTRSDSKSSAAGSDDESTNEKNRGYIISSDSNPAKPHCPDGSKFIVEKIIKGMYKYQLFDKLSRHSARRFRFNDSDHSSDGEKSEFDWNDSEQVQQVQNWRRQYERRANADASSAQPARTAYFDVEMEFLWSLHAQHLEEVLGENPDYLRNGGTIPLPLSRERLQAWTREFNARFEGQTVVDGVRISDQPRPRRTSGSLEAQRHRVGGIILDFLVPENVAHARSGTCLTGRGHGNVKGRPNKTKQKAKQKKKAKSTKKGAKSATQTSTSGSDESEADEQSSDGDTEDEGPVE